MGNLTEQQLKLFPELLAGYLQRNGGEGLAVLIKGMSEDSKYTIYQICETEFKRVLESQSKQLEDAKHGK